ncbi:hypothetical protein V8F33_007261 [Rhypophila sp. PSN 637]
MWPGRYSTWQRVWQVGMVLSGGLIGNPVVSTLSDTFSWVAQRFQCCSGKHPELERHRGPLRPVDLACARQQGFPVSLQPTVHY